MSEYCKNCFELAEKVTKKEREYNTLKSQLDFAVQQKECFEQECEKLEDFRTLARDVFTFGDSDVDDENFIKYLQEYSRSYEEAIDGYYRLTDITGIDYTVHGGADIEEIIKRVDSLKHECEELKNNLHIANTNHEAAEQECDRYRKALEEIEEICIKDTYIFADGTQIRYDSLDDILAIINKAKGEN